MCPDLSRKGTFMQKRNAPRPHWLALVIALGLSLPVSAQRVDPGIKGEAIRDRTHSDDAITAPSDRASDSTPIDRIDPSMNEGKRPTPPARRHKKSAQGKDGQTPRAGDTPPSGADSSGSSGTRRHGAPTDPGTGSGSGGGAGYDKGLNR